MDVQGCGKEKNLCLKFLGTTNQWGAIANKHDLSTNFRQNKPQQETKTTYNKLKNRP